jgi:hypothetical protein
MKHGIITLIIFVCMLTGLYSGISAQTSFPANENLTEYGNIESSVLGFGNKETFAEGIVQVGISAGYMYKPVFRADSDPVIPECSSASLLLKAGIFVPISRIGIDISGSLTHARFRDFTYSSGAWEYEYINPQLTFAMLEFGFHVQVLRDQPVTAYIQSQMGLKFYTEPEREFMTTNRTSSEFSAGLAFGARYFMNPRLSLQLEYRNLGTFTVRTTISGGTSTTENLNAYTGIISLGAFFHLF